jgi:hypothetical protein
MVRIFDPLVIPPPRDAIFRRLGYRKGATRVPTRLEEETEGHIEEALSLIRLRGAARRMPIAEHRTDTIVLEERTVFSSRKLAAFLGGCAEILLVGATAGADIVAAIQRDTSGSDVTRGVVFDATASEMVDAALAMMTDFYRQTVRREGKAILPRRYSCGYGDFPLDAQGEIFRLLDLGRFGVTVTEHHILVPEKSVTAITGIC